MKKILGLDLGTNSIGWALIQQDFIDKKGEILGMGSRIIPMSQDILGDFGKGNSVSQTAERTRYRGVRRLRERHLLRRQRLHRVLNVLGFLPENYASKIDFEKKFGQFLSEKEPKIAYKATWNEEKNKYEYSFQFKNSFAEMLLDFQKSHPSYALNGSSNERLIPYDWTIYYLRKKALTQKIEKEELSWILLNFNQKRGYYQLRGEEEEENANKVVEFYSLYVVDVLADDPVKGKSDIWYSLILENGWVYRRSSKTPLYEWKGKLRDFIVSTDLNEDGSIKVDNEGKEKRSFRAPSESDWTLQKKKTEKEIDKSHKTVGTFIYDSLLKDPSQKIKGKLVRTIERKFYRAELRQILQKQIEFHPELRNADLYNECIRELYRNNSAHQLLLDQKDFLHLFLNDIIFYQRPLRSQKSSISNCTLEFRKYRDQQNNENIQFLKVIPKSNPLYQEFRLWQWMFNLAIYKKEGENNVTSEFLNKAEDWEGLFDFLNNRKEIEQKPLIKFLLEKAGIKGKQLSSDIEKYRWNFVEDKSYPCNVTKALINSRLAKVMDNPTEFLTRKIESHLWHIIYSVTDKIDYEKALRTFAQKYDLDSELFVDAFLRFPPFKSEYGSFSEKAIKKLLPLMRFGKYWSWDNIDKYSKKRIENIITGEYDEQIKDRVREKALNLTSEQHFQGLQLWLAQYIVYDRHSESDSAEKWNTVSDLENYINNFKQHTLRNPIVEQVITETLRVVRDIWLKYGNGGKDFFDEIHVELGREMKNTADARQAISKKISENENTNLRIKSLLAELINDSTVENVRPHSPMQQDILRIYEEGVLSSNIEIDEEILKISKTAQPSSADLRRYKLWLEQKYRSPYTGNIIPLNKLFTPEYEIEHIIPQSRYFDDSLSNKVICESAVNKLKDKQLALEFIKNHKGQKLQIGESKSVTILNIEEYEDFIKLNYSKNQGKRGKLLLEEIPEKMIERQLNDTRYISKLVSSLLSNIVRSENNDDGVNSKNMIPGNGKITSELKQDWGLNDVWNELILPRFERMNVLTNSDHFTSWNEKYKKFLPTVPIELSRGFNKKRIDHRHHAMDALVIACATRDHINLLNNKYAESKVRFDLQRKLRHYKQVTYTHPQTGMVIEREVPTEFIKPWPEFSKDALKALEVIIISFKQNLRVINKATNYYEKWAEKDGVMVKERKAQEGTNWAIRKPMHKETVSGLVKLRKKKSVLLSAALEDYSNIVSKELRDKVIELVDVNYNKKMLHKFFTDRNKKWEDQDVSRVEIYYWQEDNVASRVSLNDTFNEKKIETITDTGIQKILLNHLNNYKNRLDIKGKEIAPELMAFSPEGIDEMNKNIKALNDGVPHQPILKVRTFEPLGNKFAVGSSGNKKDKYVEAAKGTNLFFGVYQDATGKRSYETIPLNIVIERQKQGLSPVATENEKGDKLLFFLSPNDLVYIPSEEEKENFALIEVAHLNKHQVNNIYKVVSFTGNRLFLVKNNIAASIVDKVEFSALNKMEKSIDGTMIKGICLKINIDRLGFILSLGTGTNY